MNDNAIVTMLQNSALPPARAGFADVLKRIDTARERGELCQPVPPVPMQPGSTVKRVVKGTLVTAAALTLVAGAGMTMMNMSEEKSEAPEENSAGMMSDSAEGSYYYADEETSSSDLSPSDAQAASQDDEENIDED